MHIVRTNIEGTIDVKPSGHVHCESQAQWFNFEDALPREHD